ncbi:CBM35 domain-containing protein [Microbacterium sp. NPDC007973]|uniref:CBM35 domain-containing protein n=1 Tax=Microbacterium sp. NPDC007973 TaxID=3364182 RepID=UPI0036E44730
MSPSEDTSRRSRRIMRAAGAALAAVAVVTAVSAVVPATAAVGGNTLSIDASKVIRPATHVASGGLYALATDTVPDKNVLLPLRLNQLTQPAPGVQQLGNGATTPSGDALKVAPTAIATGAQQTIRMPDIYPDWPYKWVSWDDYLGKVRTMVQARLDAKSTTNINGWELWNEPDGTWNTSAAGNFTDGWAKIHAEVRKLDGVTPIVGPSIQGYNHDWMLSFLTAAKKSNTVPDIISWHQWNADVLPGQLADLRKIESSLGITPRPVSINEYAWPDQVDVPSSSLRYISTFERETDVRDAERPYWFESGTVNGLLHNGQPTGTYWLYKWYGDMTGNIVSVTQNGAQDGVAALDSTRKILNAVVGGATGNNSVSIAGLGGFGSSVQATVSYTPDSGRFANVAAPTTVWSGTLSVSNGAISVPLTGQDPAGAYQILVTPTTGPTTSYQQTYEAENASVSNAIRYSSTAASNGGYVGGIDTVGDARNNSFVDFQVQVPVAGDYALSIRYANGTGSTSTQGLAYNGGGWTTVSYPSTGGWGSTGKFGTVSGPTLKLNAGFNTIRLAKGSPYFAGGSGYAELDSITVTTSASVPTWTAPANPPAATFVSRKEAESATIAGGTAYSSGNASNGSFVGSLDAKDSAVTFTFDAPSAGAYTLTLGAANSGGFFQNGTPSAVVAVSVNGGSANDTTVPVTGPWGANGGFFAAVTTTVQLNAGSNTIRVGHKDGQNYAELDYAQVSNPAGAVVR